MGSLIIILTLIAAVAIAYVLLLRPLLRRWSVLKQFWSQIDAAELTIWTKIRLLFEGLKIKLLARILWVPGALVNLYDWIGPQIAGADLSPLNLPVWFTLAGPIVIGMLIDWARTSSNGPAATASPKDA